ncbi:MAG TPA: hypothetical protein PK668_25660 [Myxococcota bacterium]|nr:hypothetical protein [Myxococcota bacterium]HRY96915.1 hypothetical protein [Myxococcota bacterium]HSA22036.1 hypothetical protein [Myxococcota bacterium]
MSRRALAGPLLLLLLGAACGPPWYARYGIKDEKDLNSYRALPGLKTALEKGSCFDLKFSGEALERIGARAYTIQESMQRAFLRDECRAIQREPMARALGLIGKRAFGFLSSQLQSPDLVLRSLGVVGLGQMRSEGARVVPLLLAAAGAPKENAVWSLGVTDPRVAALEGLGHFGARAEPALPLLVAALADGDLAPAAARALAAIGLARPEVIAGLHAYALGLGDEEQKRQVVADLEKLAPGSAKDIPLPPPKPPKAVKRK